MPFEKGKPRTGGRPKGSANRVTGALRARIEHFLNDNFEEVAAEFGCLEGKDKVKAFTDLLQYVLPKLKPVDTESNLDKLLAKVSDEELVARADEVLQQYDEEEDNTDF